MSEHHLVFWDKWRAAIVNGDTSSWPRDEFESIICGFEYNLYTSQAREAALQKKLEAAESKIKALQEQVSQVTEKE